MDSTLIETLLSSIGESSSLQTNGCLFYKGRVTRKGTCYVDIDKNLYNVHHFLWNYHHPDNPIDIKYEICLRTCGDKTCINIKHLKIASRKKVLNKNDIRARIDKNSTSQKNGCVHWNGIYSYRGEYANTTVNGKQYSLHRIIYWLNSDLDQIDDIPKVEDNVKMVIRHVCNDSKCINPNHLKLGTEYENSFDKIANNTLPRGEKHYNASITEDKAQEIKLSKYSSTDKRYKTQKERATYFKVSLHVIKSIDSRKSWAYLPDNDGNISTKRRDYTRESRREKRSEAEKSWTPEMINKYNEAIKNKWVVSQEIRRPHVDTPCHLWQGKLSRQGYADLTIHGKRTAVHIVACEIRTGTRLQKNQVTRHLCGINHCINSQHLKFGTNQENAHDTLRHGRGRAKLNEEMVKEIRATRGNDGLTQIERAEKYGVTTGTLNSVEKHRTWKHIQ